jgi:hypothetical protein
MITNLTKSLAAVALLGSLAACGNMAGGDAAPSVAPLTTHDWDARVPTEVRLDGPTATHWMSSETKLNDALDKYGAVTGPPPANLKARIQQISNGNSPLRNGLGGIFADGVLDAALDALVDKAGPNEGKFDKDQKLIVTVSGQILDYGYNATDGSGHIESITYITRTRVPKGTGTPRSRETAYKYKVVVDPGGFTVVNRDDNAMDGPFPGTLPFTPEMKANVHLRELMYKLWAKGTKIRVTEVSVKRNYDPTNPPPAMWQPLPANHPIYSTNDQSCIDMMFKITPPPVLPNGAEPPFYCLGRCSNPFLVNTR